MEADASGKSGNPDSFDRATQGKPSMAERENISDDLKDDGPSALGSRRKGLSKSVIDAIMIVFSVLLALMLNKSFDAWQEHKRVTAAENAIKSEISENQALVKSLLEIHLAISKRLAALANGKGDSLRRELLSKQYFDLWVLTDHKSFLPKFPSSTAWETSKATGVISEFDYHEVEILTDIYAQQEIVYKGTVGSIVNVIFDRQTNDLRYFDSTIIQFQLRVNELIAQERTLMKYYEDWQNRKAVP